MNDSKKWPSPPKYDPVLAGWGHLHLAHGTSSKSSLRYTGLGFNVITNEFVLYSYHAWPDKDGVGATYTAGELIGCADELEEIGAGWLIPVLHRIKDDDSNATPEIIAAYKNYYGKEPYGASSLPSS